MAVQDFDLGAAVELYLAEYPNSNKEEFAATFPDESAEKAVRGILRETSGLQVDWGQKSLREVGDEVQQIMSERHPELSDAAADRLGDYFTFLMK